MTLHLGGKEIQILHIGEAHTRGEPECSGETQHNGGEVIVPGVTTRIDVAWWVQDRLLEMGVRSSSI